MSDWVKGLFGSVFGAVFGGFFTLQIWPPLWWIGVLIGALAGYLACSHREVIRAIPEAWRMATRPRSRVRLRIFGRNFTTAMIFYSNIWPFGIIVYASFPWVLATVICTICLSGVSLFFALLISSSHGSVEARRGISEMHRFHPLYVYGSLLPSLLRKAARQTVRFAPQLAASAVMAIVTVLIACARFVRYLFLLIHSEARMICAFDAAVGAVAVYFTNSLLIGAAVAAAAWAINYEILAKRVLRTIAAH